MTAHDIKPEYLADAVFLFDLLKGDFESLLRGEGSGPTIEVDPSRLADLRAEGRLFYPLSDGVLPPDEGEATP